MYGNIRFDWVSYSFQKQLLEVFYEKVVLKSFVVLIGKHLCWSLFLIKLVTLRPATLLNRDFNTSVLLLIFGSF